MLQCMIFQGSNMISIQDQINHFFKTTKKAAFVQATQSTTGHFDDDFIIVITVWYYATKK